MLGREAIAMQTERTVGYFSMEIALEAGLPTYSGGLGVLAGDTIRSAADLKVPMVAVALLHQKGYFYQRLDASGWQTEEPAEWIVQDFLEEMPPRVTVKLEGRPVQIRAWKYKVKGIGGVSPVYLLDSDLPENAEWDRKLTDYLYGGDWSFRLCQETVLASGRAHVWACCSYKGLTGFQTNEGHASLPADDRTPLRAGPESQPQDHRGRGPRRGAAAVHLHHAHPGARRARPVPGRDGATADGPSRTSGSTCPTSWSPASPTTSCGGATGNAVGANPIGGADMLNMTYLALNLSHYVNGVAKKHAEVSQPHVRRIPRGRHHQRRPRRDLDQPGLSGPV